MCFSDQNFFRSIFFSTKIFSTKKFCDQNFSIIIFSTTKNIFQIFFFFKIKFLHDKKIFFIQIFFYDLGFLYTFDLIHSARPQRCTMPSEFTKHRYLLKKIHLPDESEHQFSEITLKCETTVGHFGVPISIAQLIAPCFSGI